MLWIVTMKLTAPANDAISTSEHATLMTGSITLRYRARMALRMCLEKNWFVK